FSTVAAATEIVTLSLHDALPISRHAGDDAGHGFQLRTGLHRGLPCRLSAAYFRGDHDSLRHRALPLVPHQRHGARALAPAPRDRSEEHTSELQSRENLVCRLLLE